MYSSIPHAFVTKAILELGNTLLGLGIQPTKSEFPFNSCEKVDKIDSIDTLSLLKVWVV